MADVQKKAEMQGISAMSATAKAIAHTTPQAQAVKVLTESPLLQFQAAKTGELLFTAEMAERVVAALSEAGLLVTPTMRRVIDAAREETEAEEAFDVAPSADDYTEHARWEAAIAARKAAVAELIQEEEQ